MASIISAGTTSGTALNMTGDTSGQLQLATGASATTAVTIDTSQNVGIGTTSPSCPLTVKSRTADNIGLRVLQSSNNIGEIQFTNDPVTTEWASFIATSTYLGISSLGYQTFYTNGSERMRIDSSGNLMVGISAATQTPVTGLNVTPQGNVGIGHVTGTVSGTNYITFNYNGTLIGQVYQNGTNATAYATSSDYRLKENVLPMTGALDKIAQLKPVTYTWKSDGSEGQGFIAHELQAVVPDCVSGEKDAVDAEGKPVYQGIDTSFLVATLTAAIQEQQTIINDLKARIETLEAK